MNRRDPLRRLAWVVALAVLTVAAAPNQQESDPPAPKKTPDARRQALDQDGRAIGATPAGAEARLAELGIKLEDPPKPVANYVPAVRTGNLVFLAGHGPLKPGGGYITGKLGKDLTVKEGYEAARLTAIALLSSLKAEIGSLDRVRRIVRVQGMVNATPKFTDQSKVINGCSDLLVKVFGERGKHARAAVGMVSLPIGLAVEIQMVVEVE